MAPCWVLKEQPVVGDDRLLFQWQSRHGLVSYTASRGNWLPDLVLVEVSWWGFGVGLWVVGWLLVENCTVDASILFSVVKLSRANGGCLGTRSR